MIDMLNILKDMPVPSVQTLKDSKIGCTLQKVSKIFKATPTGTVARSIIRSWKVSLKQEETFSTIDQAAVGGNSNNQSPGKCRKSTRESKPVLSYSQEAASAAKTHTIGTKLAGLMSIAVFSEIKPIPQRNTNNELLFPEYPTFRPNLTPKEILQAGLYCLKRN
jgi:hypothetical protein